jgi:hypothetical protein
LAAVVPPGLAGLPFGLSRNLALPQVLAFWSAGGRGLVAPSSVLSVCATRFSRPWVWPAVRRFVPVPPGFQPCVAQAVRPPSPRPAFARVSGRVARFRFLVRSGIPTPPAGSGGQRIRLRHAVSASAAPLSSGVGHVQERASARRAGRSAGKLWAAVVPPGLAGLPFGLPRNWAVSQVLAFRPDGGRGLAVFVGVRQPIRLRHAVSALGLARSAPVCSSPAGVPAVRGASRPAPVAPSGFCSGFRLGRPLSFLVQSGSGIAAHS